MLKQQQQQNQTSSNSERMSIPVERSTSQVPHDSSNLNKPHQQNQQNKNLTQQGEHTNQATTNNNLLSDPHLPQGQIKYKQTNLQLTDHNLLQPADTNPPLPSIASNNSSLLASPESNNNITIMNKLFPSSVNAQDQPMNSNRSNNNNNSQPSSDTNNKLPRIIDPAGILVIPSEVEGELLIDYVIPLQLSTCRVIWAVVVSIMTCLIYALCLRNSLKLRMKTLFVKCQRVEQATHFYVANSDGTESIIQRINRSTDIIQKQKTSKNQRQFHNVNEQAYPPVVIDGDINQNNNNIPVNASLRPVSDGSSPSKANQKDNNNEFSDIVEFVNRHMKYRYDVHKTSFKAVYYRAAEKLSARDIPLKLGTGLNTEKTLKFLEKYGPCKIEVPVPSLMEYLANVLTEIFFIFQYLSMILWILEGYLLFAIVMILASVVISLINFCLLRVSRRKLSEFAQHAYSTTVIRDSYKMTIDSTQLLPGDVYIITNNMPIPCDSLLIKGQALINESSLTGESIPISKTLILEYPNLDETFSTKTMKKHMLFEGTKVIQSRGDEVIALVLKTGYASQRGAIFRAMLYPKTIFFDFYKNGIIFLLILMVLGFIVYFAMLSKVISISLPVTLIIYRFFDTAQWIIPPALPIFFSVCQTVALIRLGWSNVLATDPSKVVVAGSISVMCFDKTGTLTEDSMEVQGYANRTCKEILQKFEGLSESTQAENSFLQKCMGSCHGVYLVDGLYLGDELDVKMLEFSQYAIVNEEESQKNGWKFTVKQSSKEMNSLDTLRIWKTWDFESAYQRMACIVEDINNGQVYSVVKGSPEMIISMCDPNTYTKKNLEDILKSLTSQGFRVIAFAYAAIPSSNSASIQQKIATIDRKQAESNLQFAGLLLLHNQLKTDTPSVISQLRTANISIKVISGDNLLTTLHCARKANVLPMMNSETYQQRNEGNYSPGKNDRSSKSVLICQSLQNVYVENEENQEKNKEIIQILSSKDSMSKYDLVVSGMFLQEILTLKDAAKMNIPCSMDFPAIISNLLQSTVVFARCKPEHKAQIIYLIQTTLQLKVGMIGDGANDCPAIKQADIGISFTKTDAAYSSPFSSSKSSIACVVDILAEGRCTLASMIECYRYYLSVSVTKYIIACVMILEYSYMSSFFVLFINYFESIPLLVILSLNLPLKELSPITLISNLLDIQNIMSIGGQILITLAEILVSYFHLRHQDWFVPILDMPDGQDTYVLHSMTGHLMFLTCQMIFIFSLVAYFISHPVKQRIYTNKLLSICLLLLIACACVLHLSPKTLNFSGVDAILKTKTGFLGVQLIIVLCFGVLMVAYEDCFVKRFFGMKRSFLRKNLHIVGEPSSLAEKSLKNE